MACYSNETKHKCAKIVLFVSIFIGLLGLATTIFGVLQTGAGQEYTTKYGNMDLKGSFGAITIVAGILALLTGVLGCLTGKFKKFFFTLPFIIMCVILFILCVIAGALMAGDKSTLQKAVDEGCSQKYQGETFQNLIKGQYQSLVDSKLCTDFCECTDAAKQKWESYPNDQLKANFSRAHDPLASETTAYTQATDKLQYDGVIPMYFSSDSSSSKFVKNYKECYDKQLKGELESKESDSSYDEIVMKAKMFFEDGGYEMLKSLETEYDCAGICYQPMFYITKDVTEGLPSRSCDVAAVEELSGNIAGAAVAFITGISLLIGAVGAFPLFSGFNKDE